MHRRLPPLFCVTAALLAVPATAGAQAMPAPTPSATAMDVQNFWPSAGPSQALTLRGSDVQPHLSLGFGLIANFMYRPLVFRPEPGAGGTQSFDAVNYALTTDFVWGFGLFNRVQLSAAIPVVVSQSGDGISPITGGGAAAQLPQTALRDFRFDIAVALVQRARRINADGFGLRLDVGGAVPLGDERNFEGAATATFAPMAVADVRFWGFTITLNAGARVRDLAAVARVAWASQFVLGGGVAYRPLAFDRLMVGVDVLALLPLFGAVQIESQTPSGRALQTYDPFVPVELYAGGRIGIDRARDIEVTLAAGAPLTAAPTVPQFRVVLGLSYTPHGYDTDSDGVPDADDNCRTQPEDRDGFRDTDGCPDPDNDNDRIPDVNDTCPNAPEDYDNFEDHDGCPDADNDNDGVDDAEDACPNEAQGEHPDPAHRGCPLHDRDNDGVVDARDLCPEEPAGERPDPERAGCPLPDADHDGVPDAQDACPSDPRGDHPDPVRAGCPDPDRDHDGVPNETDRCPDQPETINGVTDDDGCPDAGDEVVTWAGNVLIFQNAIRLRQRARAVTAAEGALLAQAAQRIRGRGTTVERVSVQVVPAPGAAGTAEGARLAGLVADVLAQHGVPRARIDAGVVVPASGANAPRRPQPVGELRIRVELVQGVRPGGATSAPGGASSSTSGGGARSTTQTGPSVPANPRPSAPPPAATPPAAGTQAPSTPPAPQTPPPAAPSVPARDAGTVPDAH